MSTPAGDGHVGDATITVNANTTPALIALRQFSRSADGRLRDLRGRFVSESNLMNRSLTSAAGGGDRLGMSLRRISTLAGSLGAAGARIGVLAAQLGAAVPVAAGVAAALANIAPAAGVAATGALAVATAAAAVKIGMQGVSDAVAAAFNPADPEAYAQALAKLSPNAKAFVEQLHSMQPAFATLRTQVQDNLFANLDTTFKRMAAATLPQLSTAVRSSATTLNVMARGVLDAATNLGQSGALGTALTSANQGLRNLSGVPGIVVTGLGQIAAAAGPSFERLTAGAAQAATGIGDRLSKAFESGAMQRAIDNAIKLVGQLATVFGNVASIAGSVFNAAQVSGGGFIGTLVQISGALKTTFASPQVQSALQALFGTMSTLATTAAPLLGQALAGIAPILTTLGPPVQRLIGSLGTALAPVIANLSPVLTVVAGAVGKLLDAFTPILPVIGNLIASLLPPLIPAITAIGGAFQQAGPVIQTLAQTLATALAPILAQLPAIITPLAGVFSMLVRTLLPVLQRLIIALAPSLAQIGVAFGQVMTALGPLITALGQFIGGALTQMMPVINTVVGLVGRLAAVFTGELVATIQSIVIPAINVITNLLKGNFSGAWTAAKDVFSGVLDTLKRRFVDLPAQLFGALATLASKLKSRAVEAGSALAGTISDKVSSAVGWVKGLPGRAYSALSDLGSKLVGRATSAGESMVTTLREKFTAGVTVIKGLPGRAVSALGNLGGKLVSAGEALIGGFITGIKNKVGSAVSAVSGVLDKISGLFPHSPAKVGPFSGKGWTLFSGQAISESLAEGMAQRTALVRRAAAMVADAASDAVALPALAGPVVSGPSAGAALGVGAMRTSSGPTTTTVINNFYLENRGALGSQRDMQDWFVKTMDAVRLQGRLPGMS